MQNEVAGHGQRVCVCVCRASHGWKVLQMREHLLDFTDVSNQKFHM